ncbi:heavy-metal-associated domain-containing protein [Chitinophaga deserti]|uniref:heavy-metal-associated domain-containing protein n=1 Tax=Chitinophaga deserti TaxID=2164099 RepID=UPI000D6B3416|nr:cation transporter [Chitinophaga deserti]
MKSVFSFLTVAICLFFAVPAASAQTKANEPQKALVQVINLTCDGDMPTIKKQLINQDGIESVEFTKRASGSSAFTILYNADVISLDLIHKTIEKTPGCDDKSTTPYRVKKEKKAKEAKQ